MNSILSPKLIEFWPSPNKISPSPDFFWVDLDEPIAHRYSWFLKADDWTLVLDPIVNPPIEPPPSACIEAGLNRPNPKFTLPGLPDKISLYDPICVVNSIPVRFYWSDATQQGGLCCLKRQKKPSISKPPPK